MAKHLAIPYRTDQYTQSPFDLIIINLETGVAGKYPGALGRFASAVFLNDVLYFHTSDPGYFGSFNGSSSRIIGPSSDKILYSSCIGREGNIYLGTFPKGRVEKFDPVTETLTSYGDMDPGFTGSQYAYSIAADDNFVYVGLGQSPWYLAVLNLATEEKTLFFKEFNGTTGRIYTSQDGTEIYYDRGGGAAHRWFRLENGVPTPIASSERLPMSSLDVQNNILFAIDDDDEYEFDVSDGGAWTGHDPTIRWKLKTSDEWQSVTVPGIRKSPMSIRRLVPFKDSFIVIGSFYSPTLTWNPNTNTTEIFGTTRRNIYDVLVRGTDVYLSGYATVTFRWDTTQPWTLSGPNDDFTHTNPRQVLKIHKYHYYQTFGLDGVLYVAVQHLRDSTGGELAWYNPETEASGKAREPYSAYYPKSIAAVGNHIVWSGEPMSSGSGKLFVVNTATKQIDYEWDIAGLSEGGVIMDVSNTDLVGVADTIAYRLNILTGSEVWRVNLPGVAFGSITKSDRRLWKENDQLWFSIDNSIYKMDIADGSLEKFSDEASSYSVVIRGEAVYLYGGAEIKVRSKYSEE